MKNFKIKSHFWLDLRWERHYQKQRKIVHQHSLFPEHGFLIITENLTRTVKTGNVHALSILLLSESLKCLSVTASARSSSA